MDGNHFRKCNTTVIRWPVRAINVARDRKQKRQRETAAQMDK